MKKVLIVEDDRNLGTTLMGILEVSDLNVHYSEGTENVTETIIQHKPDIILMDVLLPNQNNGFKIVEQIRRKKIQTPVLFITSLEGSSAIKRAFSFKNTDYVNKPFKVREVILRVQNMLTKQYSYNLTENNYKLGSSLFYPGERMLVRGTERLRLSIYQTKVLSLLIRNKDSFVKRAEIIHEVWDVNDCSAKKNSLNNVICSLRKFFADDPSVTIISVIKLGVRLTIRG
ncbi:response regulator transcription factor [Paludibacter sp.]